MNVFYFIFQKSFFSLFFSFSELFLLLKNIISLLLDYFFDKFKTKNYLIKDLLLIILINLKKIIILISLISKRSLEFHHLKYKIDFILILNFDFLCIL